jgi:alpha-beta hydrolase superfamily lysophospholipase
MVESRHTEGQLAGAGGVSLQWQGWVPAKGAPIGIVVLAHGVSEHVGRYAWVADQLVDHGYAVYGADHRGHGRSGGSRAVIDRVELAVADLDAVVDLATERHPAVPIFLLGHSMGGALSIAYAVHHQERLAGLILSAPLAAMEAASTAQRVIGAALSRIAPRLGIVGIDASAVSRDRQVVADYEADPLNYHGKLPARTVAELLNAVERFPADATTLRLPILAMHGTADSLAPIAGTRAVIERAASPDKRMIEYDGLFHEILNEPEREQVVADITAWLEAHVAPVGHDELVGPS